MKILVGGARRRSRSVSGAERYCRLDIGHDALAPPVPHRTTASKPRKEPLFPRHDDQSPSRAPILKSAVSGPTPPAAPQPPTTTTTSPKLTRPDFNASNPIPPVHSVNLPLLPLALPLRAPTGYGARFPDFVFDGIPCFDLLLGDLGLKGWGWFGEVFWGGNCRQGDNKGLVGEWRAK